jgi:hypothetical protein
VKPVEVALKAQTTHPLELLGKSPATNDFLLGWLFHHGKNSVMHPDFFLLFFARTALTV